MDTFVNQIYLASCSPRRHELLAGLGYRFEVLQFRIDENRRIDESAPRYVERMAREKALAGFALANNHHLKVPHGRVRPVVVGADTIVVVDDKVLGKPRDKAESLQHLEWLSGRAHDVLSAVAVVSGGAVPSEVEVRLCPTKVWFRTVTARERKAYQATGEPLGKAGSYAIQGRAAAFVTRIEGNWSAVVGLPLPDTVELLQRAGVPYRF